MFKKINYNDLNSKAKEMYNYQKFSSVLADYGYTTMWLNNDWEGADFIGIHCDGETTIKVQLKGRLTFSKKYIGKSIFVCFIENNTYYLYPHDEVLKLVEESISDKKWISDGSWSTPKMSNKFQTILEKFTL